MSGFLWRWGSCPTCRRDAWISTADAGNVACSGSHGYSIWRYLESEYAWEREYGDAGFAHLFDDRGRVPMPEMAA